MQSEVPRRILCHAERSPKSDLVPCRSESQVGSCAMQIGVTSRILCHAERSLQVGPCATQSGVPTRILCHAERSPKSDLAPCRAEPPSRTLCHAERIPQVRPCAMQSGSPKSDLVPRRTDLPSQTLCHADRRYDNRYFIVRVRQKVRFIFQFLINKYIVTTTYFDYRYRQKFGISIFHIF
jgi:hypothetical protein